MLTVRFLKALQVTTGTYTQIAAKKELYIIGIPQEFDSGQLSWIISLHPRDLICSPSSHSARFGTMVILWFILLHMRLKDWRCSFPAFLSTFFPLLDFISYEKYVEKNTLKISKQVYFKEKWCPGMPPICSCFQIWIPELLGTRGCLLWALLGSD